MPAVKDVGARFNPPACRHAVRRATYTNCLCEPVATGPFASSTAAVVRNAG